MCEFFSCVVVQDGTKMRILFTEENSHHTILERAGLTDADYEGGKIVMLECEPPFNTVRLDAPWQAPIWYAKKQLSINKSVIRLAKRIAPIRQKANAEIAAIRQKANAEIDPIRQKRDAEIDPIRQKRDAEIDAIWQKLYAEIDPIRQDFIAFLRTIDGYLPKP